jgi:lysozyme
MNTALKRTFVVIGIAALGAFLFWFGYLAHYRPPKEGRYVYGIDVSHYQGSNDWEKVANDGISATYIKATEGSSSQDSMFADNLGGANRVGLHVGAYHFFSLCSEGKTQAANFLENANPANFDLPPAVDLEFGPGCVERPSVRQFRKELSAFVTTVESATGRPVLFYVGASFDQMYHVSGSTESAGRPTWAVSFARKPSSDFAVWQVHGFAQVAGINGRVDFDLVDLEALDTARVIAPE